MSCSNKLYQGDMKLAESVNLDQFMGRWYVIETAPTFLEKNCQGGIEQYDLREDGGVDITFTCYKDTLDGKAKTLNMRGWALAQNEWRVQLLWPIKASYLILEVDKDYQWTVIGHPSKDYVWIMHRDRQMPADVLAERRDNLKRQGYDLSKVLTIEQPQSYEQVRKVSLKELQWKNRIVYIHGKNREMIKEQQRELSREKYEKEDRKLLVLFPEELSVADSQQIVESPGEDFQVYLIGLDGSVKFKSKKIISLQSIFSMIDAMPMRQK